MCFFSGKKIKALRQENDRLNDELLTAKQQILKLAQDKSQLLDSCFDIITDAFPNPDERAKWLNELGKYRKEEKPTIKKFIYILIIDLNDRQLFLDNYRSIASDLNIAIDNCQFIKNDMGDIHYKIVILASKESNIDTFWEMLEQIMGYEIDYTRY